MAFDFTIIILIGYFLGVVPPGLLIVKWVRGVDVRNTAAGTLALPTWLALPELRLGSLHLFLTWGKER